MAAEFTGGAGAVRERTRSPGSPGWVAGYGRLEVVGDGHRPEGSRRGARARQTGLWPGHAAGAGRDLLRPAWRGRDRSGRGRTGGRPRCRWGTRRAAHHRASPRSRPARHPRRAGVRRERAPRSTASARRARDAPGPCAPGVLVGRRPGGGPEGCTKTHFTRIVPVSSFVHAIRTFWPLSTLIVGPG
jgi:hypothetical protein